MIHSCTFTYPCTIFLIQIVLFLGMTVLLASTYVTIYSGDASSSTTVVKMAQPHVHVPDIEEQKIQQLLDGQPAGERDAKLNPSRDKLIGTLHLHLHA